MVKWWRLLILASLVVFVMFKVWEANKANKAITNLSQKVYLNMEKEEALEVGDVKYVLGKFPPCMATKLVLGDKNKNKIESHLVDFTNCVNNTSSGKKFTSDQVQTILVATIGLSTNPDCLEYEMFCVNNVLYRALHDKDL